jgi:hypothetical protein
MCRFRGEWRGRRWRTLFRSCEASSSLVAVVLVLRD